MQDSIYLLAVRYLSYRSRSVKEVRDYLHTKNVASADSDPVIHKLIAQKFLNDDAFARMWIHSRLAHKPKSQSVLRLELRQKGIDPEIITQALADISAESGNDYAMALILVEKLKDKYMTLDAQKRFQKIAGFLLRRGFTYDIAKRVIDSVFRS